MFTSSRRHGGLPSRFRPRLESLENRTLLSDCSVSLLTDTGQKGDLRYCITQATDGDTISFKVSGIINLTSALPDLTQSIHIEGPGADMLTVRRDTGGNYRIFTVGSGTMVTIEGLTIANGYVGGNNGGGIFNQGTLSVSTSIFSGNSASAGGGGDGGGIFNQGTLTVSDSVFSGNSSVLSGGGITNAGTLMISNSTFSTNHVFPGDGGGIYNRATLTISDSTFSGNSTSAGAGGGIFNQGTLTVSNSTFSGNASFSSGGGGITNAGMLMISSSRFSGNSATTGSGGSITNRGTLTISDSTFSGNSAFGGGGIENDGGTLTVSNSTFSGNHASPGDGGGIYNRATLTISDSTFSGNVAFRVMSPSFGGAIYSEGALHARNTIIAGNTASTAPDLQGNLGSLGHNLIGNTDGGGGFDATDLLNVDPQLGPLQDNGGPTQTMALLCGSPAIDAGDNTDAPDWDQRGEGFPRIVNGIIDIGAYEVQKGECDGSAPHGPRNKSSRFAAMGLVPHETCQSRFTDFQLSAGFPMNPLPVHTESFARTQNPQITFLISHPRPKPLVEDSLFMDLNWDFWELGFRGSALNP